MKYNPYKSQIRGVERWASPRDKRDEKRFRHRQFRRLARRAIWQELKGDEGVSQRFFFPGNWLM